MLRTKKSATIFTTTVSWWCHEARDTVHPVPAQLALHHGHLDLPARCKSAHYDKRPEDTKEQPAECGTRIGLTFCPVSTFLTPLLPPPSISAGQERKQPNQQLIFGQGATGKTRLDAARLLVAFGEENHESGFD